MDTMAAQAAAAVDRSTDASDVDTEEIQLISQERETALRNSDYSTLDAQDEKNRVDLGTLLKTIDDHGEAAFNEMEDENGRQIYVCSNEKAMFWVQVKQDEAAKAAAPAETRDQTVFNPTVEVGTMSKGGGQSIFTVTSWKESIDHLTIGAFAAGIGNKVGRKIFSALTQKAAEAVAEAAEIAAAGSARAEAYAALKRARLGGNTAEINAATKALKAARANVDKVWMKNLPKGGAVEKLLGVATRFPKISRFLGGTIVAIITTIVLEVVNYFVNKDYFVRVQVSNFDKRDWKIDDWYHDNGIIAGGSAWDVETIRTGKKETVTPWGTKMAKWKAINSVTYYFQNSFTLTDGVGVALRAVTTDGKAGFAMAYLCKFWTSNRLTVKAGHPSSIKDFYDDEKNWPEGHPLSLYCQVTMAEGDKIVVKGSTNALKGVSNGIYKFNVLIASDS